MLLERSLVKVWLFLEDIIVKNTESMQKIIHSPQQRQYIAPGVFPSDMLISEPFPANVAMAQTDISSILLGWGNGNSECNLLGVKAHIATV